MPALQDPEWCGKVAFRGATWKKISDTNLYYLLKKHNITFVVDVCKQPDRRWFRFVPQWIVVHIPSGHTASISTMEKVSDIICDHTSQGENVMVVSYHGRNRAPCLAAMACVDYREVEKLLNNPRYFDIPFFRSLLEET